MLLSRAAFNAFIPQPVLILGVALAPVHMGPLLKLFQVPLSGILSLRFVNCTTQLGVTCKLAKGALDPTVYVIDEYIKQYWSQYRQLRDTSCHQSPSGTQEERVRNLRVNVKGDWSSQASFILLYIVLYLVLIPNSTL
ncbi:neuropilin and tolloid-like protein 1 [Limosa lapponica baueri]|uniref:Neuropilin and tolloid-like protein 1 n=1 Tax=Limosa lapponica baueri TaxID=1758121 RepID=A0A2I0TJC5_LIMLA|nr:neuropilin and tolloid-like protein 1 [Limosa lapponica baueri]